MIVESFHSYTDTHSFERPHELLATTTRERTLSYQFRTHFHAYVSELVDRLVTGSVPGLQDADTATVEENEAANCLAACSAASGSSVASTPRPPAPTPAIARISDALPRMMRGRSQTS